MRVDISLAASTGKIISGHCVGKAECVGEPRLTAWIDVLQFEQVVRDGAAVVVPESLIADFEA
jgi:hypothetical protein